MLTASTDPTLLPAFLRNCDYLRTRRRNAAAGRGASLYAQLPGSGIAPRADHQLCADAAAALRRVREAKLHRARWYWVEQTVEVIGTALRTGDLDALRDSTVDLELADRVHESSGTANERVEVPKQLATLISATIDRLGTRTASSRRAERP